jgi:transcriptional regulator with PAS, ATPase and Fis domain
MYRLFDLAKSAARSQSTILILGESGTGKELLARAVHAESPRQQAGFVAVSCAALTESLLESELFGHERGAFTGAVARRKGKFETAHGGTLFLDEIGDITAKLQLDLLRVLEDRRFFRVGGSEAVEVDVRIIAATNRDLRKAVEDGDFREDLFYRLHVIPITLPPLRDRREDIPLLVDHFLDHLNIETNRKIEGVSAAALAVLMRYDWPGNVRELRNALERGLVVAKGALVQPDDLGLTISPARADSFDTSLTLEEVERRHITAVLHASGGNVTQAARTLAIDRVTLYNKIKKYGLRRGDEDGTFGA